MSSNIRPNEVRQNVTQDSSQAKEVRMFDRVVQRLGAASGVLYVVLLIIGGNIRDSGEAAPPPEGVAQAFANQTTFTIAWILEVLAFLCFLCFLGYLCQALRRAEGDHGWLATAAFGGGVMSIAIKLGSAAPIFAAFHHANESLDPQIARALQDMNDASFFLSFYPLVVLLGAAAIVAIRYGVLPRWLGWTAAVLAIALIAGATVGVIAGVEDAGLPFMLFLLWIVLTSIVLTRRVGQRSPVVNSASVSLPPAVP
jgi:hypothetical protein